MEIKYSTKDCETLLKLKINNQQYTLSGYSRAGLKTCILVDEFNACFDMGYANEKAFSYGNKLISHGHIDHIGGLHFDRFGRQFHKISKQNQIIMPQQCINPYKMILSAQIEMNAGRNGKKIKILSEQENTKIIDCETCIEDYQPLLGNTGKPSEYVIKTFIMDHKIKSFGYIIYRKTKKLKKEYQGLSGEEIIKIKQTMNEEITEISITPLLGYSGDTTIHGILNNPEFLTVPLLIMECTGFTDDLIENCAEGKHIHINDIDKYYEKFMNEKIILFHFSQQYKDISELIDIVKNKDKLILFY